MSLFGEEKSHLILAAAKVGKARDKGLRTPHHLDRPYPLISMFLRKLCLGTAEYVNPPIQPCRLFFPHSPHPSLHRSSLRQKSGLKRRFSLKMTVPVAAKGKCRSLPVSCRLCFQHPCLPCLPCLAPANGCKSRRPPVEVARAPRTTRNHSQQLFLLEMTGKVGSQASD
jgi:hypothetical protein